MTPHLAPVKMHTDPGQLIDHLAAWHLVNMLALGELGGMDTNYTVCYMLHMVNTSLQRHSCSILVIEVRLLSMIM